MKNHDCYTDNVYSGIPGSQGQPKLQGETELIGVTGPTGPTGPQGPIGDYCCKNTVMLALQTIQDNKLGDVTLNYLDTSVKGTITENIKDIPDVVVLNVPSLGGYIGYFSLCNVTSIAFSNAPTFPLKESDLPYNCDDVYNCYCNPVLEQVLRACLGANPNFPVEIDTIYIKIRDNSDTWYNIKTVYGICTGILWAELEQTTLGSKYVAIPLCSIFGVYNKV